METARPFEVGAIHHTLPPTALRRTNQRLKPLKNGMGKEDSWILLGQFGAFQEERVVIVFTEGNSYPNCLTSHFVRHYHTVDGSNPAPPGMHKTL